MPRFKEQQTKLHQMTTRNSVLIKEAYDHAKSGGEDPEDAADAFAELQNHAAQDTAEKNLAKRLLAECLRFGYGCTKDVAAAKKILLELPIATTKDTYAAHALASLLEEEENNLQEAAFWYVQAYICGKSSSGEEEKLARKDFGKLASLYATLKGQIRTDPHVAIFAYNYAQQLNVVGAEKIYQDLIGVKHAHISIYPLYSLALLYKQKGEVAKCAEHLYLSVRDERCQAAQNTFNSFSGQESLSNAQRAAVYYYHGLCLKEGRAYRRDLAAAKYKLQMAQGEVAYGVAAWFALAELENLQRNIASAAYYYRGVAVALEHKSQVKSVYNQANHSDQQEAYERLQLMTQENSHDQSVVKHWVSYVKGRADKLQRQSDFDSIGMSEKLKEFTRDAIGVCELEVSSALCKVIDQLIATQNILLAKEVLQLGVKLGDQIVYLHFVKKFPLAQLVDNPTELQQYADSLLGFVNNNVTLEKKLLAQVIQDWNVLRGCIRKPEAYVKQDGEMKVYVASLGCSVSSEELAHINASKAYSCVERLYDRILSLQKANDVQEIITKFNQALQKNQLDEAGNLLAQSPVPALNDESQKIDFVGGDELIKRHCELIYRRAIDYHRAQGVLNPDHAKKIHLASCNGHLPSSLLILKDCFLLGDGFFYYPQHITPLKTGTIDLLRRISSQMQLALEKAKGNAQQATALIVSWIEAIKVSLNDYPKMRPDVFSKPLVEEIVKQTLQILEFVCLYQLPIMFDDLNTVLQRLAKWGFPDACLTRPYLESRPSVKMFSMKPQPDRMGDFAQVLNGLSPSLFTYWWPRANFDCKARDPLTEALVHRICTEPEFKEAWFNVVKEQQHESLIRMFPDYVRASEGTSLDFGLVVKMPVIERPSAPPIEVAAATVVNVLPAAAAPVDLITDPTDPHLSDLMMATNAHPAPDSLADSAYLRLSPEELAAMLPSLDESEIDTAAAADDNATFVPPPPPPPLPVEDDPIMAGVTQPSKSITPPQSPVSPTVTEQEAAVTATVASASPKSPTRQRVVVPAIFMGATVPSVSQAAAKVTSTAAATTATTAAVTPPAAKKPAPQRQRMALGAQ